MIGKINKILFALLSIMLVFNIYTSTLAYSVGDVTSDIKVTDNAAAQRGWFNI